MGDGQVHTGVVLCLMSYVTRNEKQTPKPQYPVPINLVKMRQSGHGAHVPSHSYRVTTSLSTTNACNTFGLMC